MTEGSIARVQAPSLSSFKLHLPTPGPGGLGCISPPSRGERAGGAG